MRITRIDFEGKPGCYATAQRRTQSGNVPNVVVVTLLTPDVPKGREHFVTAGTFDPYLWGELPEGNPYRKSSAQFQVGWNQRFVNKKRLNHCG